ncbi:cysteine hydrolase family protein [Methanomethylovorans sp.]|uniref:cysteine hydrolase family protein n=1 Tax=Methanomethylovorans sp. TaxID=2758717 RepID=UPI00351C8BCE
MSIALLLIDIQKDYFQDGSMEVPGSIKAVHAAQRLLDLFRVRDLPIVHVQHISTRKGATFFLPDTDGADFHESVLPRSNEAVIRKHFPNSFRDTALNEHLQAKGIKELYICGMMSQMCIDATVRAAFDKGYACTVAHDACAARGLAFNSGNIDANSVHGAYMAALGSVYAKVLSVNEIIELLNNCT